MVLALPPSTREWSEWLCDPSRLLTILSRYRWQLAMTHVVDDGIRVHAQRRKDSVQVVLDLQQNANSSWTWHSMLETLGWSVDDSDQFWDCWGAILGLFGSILGPLGAILEPSWVHLGSKMRSNSKNVDFP